MSLSHAKQWVVEGTTGFDSLKLQNHASIPKLGDRDVLVRFYGASLNFRDVIIPMGQYPFGFNNGVVPGSDGAGVVEAVGSRVTRFRKGDKVITIFNQYHQSGPLDSVSIASGLGGFIDGTFRQYGAFDETGLVAMPSNLNFLEAGTLSCAAVTAWNALYGVESRAVRAGDYVLVQGTGGVSLFALQFAKAAGAKVIATTSSDRKAEALKRAGADHVINYKTTPNWGEEALNLTPRGRGVDHIVEVGGPNTVAQSLKAINFNGVITIIGFVGGFDSKQQPSLMETMAKTCIVRGVIGGSRQQFEDLNRCIEANDIHPIIDETVFGFDDLKAAYQYMLDQRHFGKIAIKID